MMKIKIYMVGSIGTNCYLVWDDESKDAMLVDPGGYEPLIERAIDENTLRLKYILLTHGHYDHVDGVCDFQESEPDAILAACEGDGLYLKELAPGLILKDGDILELGGLSFRVIATPGHTEGGLSLYIPETDPELTDESFSGTVFSGDTLFKASIGRTDLPGGDYEELKSSIREKLFELPDDTLVLPGHMGATTIEYEKLYNPFV